MLIPVLLKDAEDPESRHDFGHNILPQMVDDYKVYSYNFIDENDKEALYWRDVGTLDAFYEANMDSCSVSPVFNLYDKSWPIRTLPAPVSAGQVRLRRPRTHRHGGRFRRQHGMHRLRRRRARIAFSRPMCASTPTPRSDSSILFSHVSVGRHCHIRKTIIDRDVKIPEGTVIGYDTEADRQKYSSPRAASP